MSVFIQILLGHESATSISIFIMDEVIVGVVIPTDNPTCVSPSIILSPSLSSEIRTVKLFVPDNVSPCIVNADSVP